MALPTTEFIIFDTNEDFRKDPSVIRAALDIVLKSDGVQSPAYYGVQIEDPKTGYLFIHWDTYAHHQAIMQAPSYPELGAAFRRSVGGDVKMYHVAFAAPTIAFTSPVTEVLVLTLNSADHRAAVVDILSKISEASGKMLVFGQTLEDENKYVLVGGWPTVEAHWETVAKPEAAAALEKLYSLAIKDHLFHTKLQTYQL